MPAERKAESVCRCDAIAATKRFPRGYRLTRKDQFDHVLSNRTVHLRCGCFRVFATENHQKGARLGLIVGKRQLKRAVDRNRVKRALRETFRINRSRLPAMDIVVQLTETPSTTTVTAQAMTMWPRLVSATGTENDQQSL